MNEKEWIYWPLSKWGLIAEKSIKHGQPKFSLLFRVSLKAENNQLISLLDDQWELEPI